MDMDAPPSLALHKVRGHIDRPSSQWNKKSNYSEDADGSVASTRYGGNQQKASGGPGHYMGVEKPLAH
jgi:hypothetical protein